MIKKKKKSSNLKGVCDENGICFNKFGKYLILKKSLSKENVRIKVR